MAEITHKDLMALSDKVALQVKDEIDRVHQDVKDDLRAVHARVREVKVKVEQQNGRIGTAEINIAKLLERVGVAAAVRRRSRPVLAAQITGALAAIAGLMKVWQAIGEAILQAIK